MLKKIMRLLRSPIDNEYRDQIQGEVRWFTRTEAEKWFQRNS